MTEAQQRRVVQAMAETQTMLERLEQRYGRRQEHLQTDDDRQLIAFYRKHVAKLTKMLEAA